MSNKRLMRDTEHAKLAGVCAGIAKYLDIDVTIIRILWAFITLFGGSGLIAYIICALIMPDGPDYTDYNNTNY